MIIDPSSTQNEKARQLFAEQDVAHTHDNNTPSVTMPVPSIPGQYQNSNEVDADLARQTQNLNIHDQYAPPSPSSLTSPLERDPPPAYSAQKADDAADAYAEQGNTSEHKPPQLSASELARSFNRPVPSRAAFPTSPSSEVAQSSNASAPTALILHSRTKRLADGFFCVPPAPFDPTIASLAQRNPRDHPFNQRDVREADWVTFLGALQRAATPSDVRMKSYCETIRERNAAPVVGDTMSENGTRSTMRRRRCGDKKGLIIGLTLGLPGYLIYRHIEARKRHAAYLRECDEAVNTSLTKAVDVVDTWNKVMSLNRLMPLCNESAHHMRIYAEFLPRPRTLCSSRSRITALKFDSSRPGPTYEYTQRDSSLVHAGTIRSFESRRKSAAWRLGGAPRQR